MSQFDSSYDDPEWKALRLRILERDDYVCRMCQERFYREKSLGTDTPHPMLRAHHLNYDRDAPTLWAYSDDELATICVTCHDRLHAEVVRPLRELAVLLHPTVWRSLIPYLKAGILAARAGTPASVMILPEDVLAEALRAIPMDRTRVALSGPTQAMLRTVHGGVHHQEPPVIELPDNSQLHIPLNGSSGHHRPQRLKK